MSRIRIDLLGAASSEPRIAVESASTRTEVFGTSLEVELRPEDAQVIVDFRVPKEILNKLKKPQAMPVFTQDLIFEAGQGSRPASHRPSTSNAGPRLHPRFIAGTDVGAALGAGSLLKYTVDCRFLPMTDMARAVDPSILQSLDATTPDPLRPSGMEVRLYECTVGAPRFWAVAFAPGNVPANSTNLHTAIFLMPKTSPYSDLSNLSLFSVRRYLLSAPANMPFFIRCGNPSDPLNDADWFSTITNVGLLDQVLQSGKPLILALPIPSGSAVVPSGPDVRELMRSLRRAVHGDELGKQVQQLPAPFRVCVSGFSRGAEIAANLLVAQQEAVDEFYWMDPPASSLSLGSRIQDWFRANSKRRLRMIGTTLNSQLHSLINQLKAPADRASAMPEPGFRRSEIYKAAVSVPVHTTQVTFPERFQDANDRSAPQPGSLSDATGIFIASDNKSATDPKVRLISRNLQNERVIDNLPPVGFTPEEIAGKARFGMLNNDRRTPPRSGTRFGERLEAARGLQLRDFIARFLLGEILHPTEAGDGSLHQWAAVGGLGGGGTSPRSGFKGFIQICLEAGDLPK